MSELDNKLERYIVRALDNELSADERLWLERELLRNPDARRMMEDYRRIDDLATGALEAVLEDGQVARNPTGVSPPQRSALRHPGRGWWLATGAAVAACLALAVARYPGFGPERGVRHGAARTPNVGSVHPGSDMPVNVMQTVGDRPALERNTGRNLLGVEGDDGNFYWLEVDRMRTIRRPGSERRPYTIEHM